MPECGDFLGPVLPVAETLPYSGVVLYTVDAPSSRFLFSSAVSLAITGLLLLVSPQVPDILTQYW